MQETWVWFLGWEDPLEKETATHSSILAWRTPGTEEPGGLQPKGSQRVRHDWATDTWGHDVKVNVKSLSRVRLFATPWANVAHQAPPSMGFSRQEYWSGLPFPSPGDMIEALNPQTSFSIFKMVSTHRNIRNLSRRRGKCCPQGHVYDPHRMKSCIYQLYDK